MLGASVQLSVSRLRGRLLFYGSVLVGLTLSLLPGVDWSDHWSFRQAGYPAIMLTDTALFRDRNYHRPSDTPEQLDYLRLARVTRGIEAVVRQLAD
jgi:Peptidase family M28